VTARLVHVPSDAIAAADPEWGAGLLGDPARQVTDASLHAVMDKLAAPWVQRAPAG
jgi:hypothetical protein